MSNRVNIQRNTPERDTRRAGRLAQVVPYPARPRPEAARGARRREPGRTLPPGEWAGEHAPELGQGIARSRLAERIAPVGAHCGARPPESDQAGHAAAARKAHQNQENLKAGDG